MVKRRKSKYKNAIINNKRYYFYSIRWVDITADGGHATEEEFEKMEPAIIVTHAYVFKRTNKLVYTFASYDEKEAVFSDRNVIPPGCILKMEKILL